MFDRYEKIINTICEYKGIKKEQLYQILKNKDCKYLLFLLLQKYGCVDYEKLKNDFSINDKRIVNYNYKKAQEKLFINCKFRNLFFEIEDMINK